MKIIKNFLKRNTNGTNLLVLAAKMDDDQILNLAANMEKVYGKDSKQALNIKGYITARKCHFNPAGF